MRLSFHFSFIHLLVAFISSQILHSVQAARINSTSMNLRKRKENTTESG